MKTTNLKKLAMALGMTGALLTGPLALAAERACIFGSEMGEVETQSIPANQAVHFKKATKTELYKGHAARFVIKHTGISTFKLSRIFESVSLQDKPLLVSLTVIKDRKTGREFHMNTTFRHIDDGDNTIGWVEEVTDAAKHDDGVEDEGRVVAVIGDSMFDSCSIAE